jgi:hypothetical protein
MPGPRTRTVEKALSRIVPLEVATGADGKPSTRDRETTGGEIGGR